MLNKIKSFFEEIYYKIVFKQLIFNSDKDNDLDELLNKFINSNNYIILDIDQYHITIKFNKITLKCWVENKFYAYLDKGTIYRDNDKILEWKNRRPSVKTIYKFYKKFEEPLRKKCFNKTGIEKQDFYKIINDNL
jgi:hypothetical protein